MAALRLWVVRDAPACPEEPPQAASRRGAPQLLSMREAFDGIEEIPYPEEAGLGSARSRAEYRLRGCREEPAPAKATQRRGTYGTDPALQILNRRHM